MNFGGYTSSEFRYEGLNVLCNASSIYVHMAVYSGYKK